MTTVGDVLRDHRRDVVSMAASESVLHAAQQMQKHGVGSILVREDAGIVGIFTEQDMLRRVVAERRDPATTALRDVMSRPVVVVHPRMRIDDCAAIMSARGIRHLPAVDAQGRMRMLSVRDVLRHQIRDRDRTVQLLINYVRGSQRPNLSRLVPMAARNR